MSLLPSMGMDDKYRLTRTGFFSVADNGLYWGVNMMTPTSLEAMDSPVEINGFLSVNARFSDLDDRNGYGISTRDFEHVLEVKNLGRKINETERLKYWGKIHGLAGMDLEAAIPIVLNAYDSMKSD